MTPSPKSGPHNLFTRAAHRVAEISGSPLAFSLALGAVLIWACSGPFFGYSDTWQLVINTATTILTFLMVFLIQNTQNRDARMIHLKLDELIRAIGDARNELIDMDELTDDQLADLEREFRRSCENASQHLERIDNVRRTKRTAQE